jgi:phosphoglycolate phosphatase-like HAD superfamily hydrolase
MILYDVNARSDVTRFHLPSGINKPSPDVALHILKDNNWGVDDPSLIWFVGDSEDDIRCGKGDCYSILKSSYIGYRYIIN